MISTSASWPDAAGRPPGRPAAPVRLGMFAPFDLLARGQEAARAFLARVADAGIDAVDESSADASAETSAGDAAADVVADVSQEAQADAGADAPIDARVDAASPVELITKNLRK